MPDTLLSLTLIGNVSYTKIGDVGVQITDGMSWADQFNSGSRSIEVWRHDAKQGASHIGQGILLGYWAGEILKLPLGLLRLNGIENPKRPHAFDALLEAITAEHSAGHSERLTPTRLATALIFQRLA